MALKTSISFIGFVSLSLVGRAWYLAIICAVFYSEILGVYKNTINQINYKLSTHYDS